MLNLTRPNGLEHKMDNGTSGLGGDPRPNETVILARPPEAVSRPPARGGIPRGSIRRPGQRVGGRHAMPHMHRSGDRGRIEAHTKVSMTF